MKKKIFIAIFIMCTAILLSLSVIAVSNSDTQLGKTLGETINSIKDSPSGDAVMLKINNTEITKSEFEVYKYCLSKAEKEYTDDEIEKKLIETTLLFEEAQSRGITVSEKEIDDAIRLAREGLADPEQKQTHDILAGYIEGLGISEDEYWDMIRPTYNKSLTIAKLKNAMLDDLSAENNSDTVSKDEFDAYFADFVKRLVARANITD